MSSRRRRNKAVIGTTENAPSRAGAWELRENFARRVRLTRHPIGHWTSGNRRPGRSLSSYDGGETNGWPENLGPNVSDTMYFSRAVN